MKDVDLINPKAIILMRMAMNFLEKKNYHLAFVTVQKAIAADNKYSRAIELKREISHILDYSRARDSQEESTKRKVKFLSKKYPSDPFVLLKLQSIDDSNYHEQKGEYDLALSCLIEYLRHDPIDYEIFLKMANLYGKKNCVNEAITFFRRAIEIEPTNFLGYFEQAKFYIDNKIESRFLEAESLLQNSLIFNSDHIYSYQYTVVLKINLKKYDDALKYINKSIELYKEFTFYLYKIVVLYKLERYDEIIEINSEIGDYENYLLYNNLGSIYCRKGDNEKALKFYNKALKLDPKNVFIYLNIMTIYEITGKEEKVERYKSIIKSYDFWKSPDPLFSWMINIYDLESSFLSEVKIFSSEEQISQILLNELYEKILPKNIKEDFHEVTSEDVVVLSGETTD